jgi:hypothetical protein
MSSNILTRPLLSWGAGLLPNARVVLELNLPAPKAGEPERRASVRVSLTATQAQEISDALHKMADATVMGQTVVTPPSHAKN